MTCSFNKIMSTENQTANENEEPVVNAAAQPEPEVIPSMDDFKEQIDGSFKKIKEGDILKGTVIGISETEVTLDLGSYTEGLIKLEELSNDPGFSIKADVTVGEELQALVISDDDGHGNIVLSKKRADDILAWESLTEAKNNKTIVKVKIKQAVKAGVIAYLYGIRAFIPASQLSIKYVENLEDWVGKEIDTVVITVSKEDKKLVLSGKEVEKDRAQSEKNNRINKLEIGIVTTGKVEKIEPYGAFINIGDGLSGLVHISQMSSKRIKTPNEVVKEGDTVTVKVTGIKDGKISLSMKAVEEKETVVKDIENTPHSFSFGGEATTGLASLLKNIKLK